MLRLICFLEGLTKGHKWRRLGWFPTIFGGEYDKTKGLWGTGVYGVIKKIDSLNLKGFYNLKITGVTTLQSARRFLIYI